MTREELAGVREFLAGLPQRRLQVADGMLLDQCQKHLADLISYIDDAGQRGSVLVEEQKTEVLRTQAEDTGHSGQGRKLETGEEPRYPEPAHIDDEPKAPKKVAHKRSTPHKR